MNSLEEIKVGEYVRTTNKGIRQIAMIDNHKTVNKYLYYIGEDFEGKSYAYIKTTEILKHSFNLIDLIEVRRFRKWISYIRTNMQRKCYVRN